MASNTNQIAIDERKALAEYMQKHDIESLTQKLVEGLLREKPEVRPKEHWAHMLRMELLQEKDAENKQKAVDTTLESQEDAAAQLTEATRCSEVPGRLLAKLFEVTKNITSEIVPKDVIRIIINETINLLHCDRVSLFVYDKRIDMLVLNASNLEQPIRVKPGQGIAGHVFKTGEVVNIPNCYEDSRFDQTFDKMTGYHTKNLLTMPIVDFEGESQGVLQAINKKDRSHFSHIDEILLENLTQHVSIALRNAEVYRAAIVTSERANALLHMIQSLSQDLGVQSTILTITMHANELVQADRCTIFLVDDAKQQLWSVSTDSGKEIRIPKSAGIAGECATEGKLIVIADAYSDPRFNQAVDKKTGYKTQSMLCIPILRRIMQSNMGQTLAVIQMINKMEFDSNVGRFDEEDIQVMETFATFVASKLEGSSLLSKKGTANESEGQKAFGGPVGTIGHQEHGGTPDGLHVHGHVNHHRMSGIAHPAAFAEGDEDEDEDG